MARLARAGLALWLLPVAAFAAAEQGVTIVHYDARLTLDIGEGTVAGEVVVKAVARGDGADVVVLDAGDLVIDSVAAGNRGLDFSATDHRVTIRLPHPLRGGRTERIALRYHGQPHHGLRFLKEQRQAYTIFSTSQWLPCLDAPDQKATLRLTLVVPEGLVAVGSGNFVRRRSGPAGLATYEWAQDTPLSTYVFGFGVGPFYSVTARQHGVDLVFMTASYSDAELRHVFADTADMLEFFEDRAGVRYPGRAYTQVIAAGNVEQEVGMFTLLGETYGRRLLDDPQDVWLAAHEFAHQWWGNGVTCRDWNHFWLNEGMATFLADAYKEHRFGRDVYVREIETSRARYEKVRVAGEDRSLVFPDWLHPTANDRAIVYHKGAYVLHLLREQLGEAKFWPALRAYTKKYMGRSVTTTDFEKAMAESSGTDLSDFFRRWVYTTVGASDGP